MYAYVDESDRHHESCLELLTTHPGPLLVPTLVITEVVHLLATRLGQAAEVRFLGDLASGALIAEPVHSSDWLRMADLVWNYRDFPLGTVDASLVASAERRKIDTIATLDYRHFTVVQPNHVKAFTLLP